MSLYLAAQVQGLTKASLKAERKMKNDMYVLLLYPLHGPGLS